MDESKTRLIDVIVDALNDLSDVDKSGDEYSKRIDDITQLYKLKMEETKYEMENERETEAKEAQIQESKKDRYFKAGVEIVGIMIPTILYAVFMNRGFKFEEEGVYKSKTFSNLTSRLPRPGKK